MTLFQVMAAGHSKMADLFPVYHARCLEQAAWRTSALLAMPRVTGGHGQETEMSRFIKHAAFVGRLAWPLAQGTGTLSPTQD
ncbi:uncharacterized [Tachysurus ichikawai]